MELSLSQSISSRISSTFESSYLRRGFDRPVSSVKTTNLAHSSERSYGPFRNCNPVLLRRLDSSVYRSRHLLPSDRRRLLHQDPQLPPAVRVDGVLPLCQEDQGRLWAFRAYRPRFVLLQSGVQGLSRNVSRIWMHRLYEMTWSSSSGSLVRIRKRNTRSTDWR